MKKNKEVLLCNNMIFLSAFIRLYNQCNQRYLKFMILYSISVFHVTLTNVKFFNQILVDIEMHVYMYSIFVIFLLF